MKGPRPPPVIPPEPIQVSTSDLRDLVNEAGHLVSHTETLGQFFHSRFQGGYVQRPPATEDRTRIEAFVSDVARFRTAILSPPPGWESLQLVLIHAAKLASELREKFKVDEHDYLGRELLSLSVKLKETLWDLESRYRLSDPLAFLEELPPTEDSRPEADTLRVLQSAEEEPTDQNPKEWQLKEWSSVAIGLHIDTRWEYRLIKSVPKIGDRIRKRDTRLLKLPGARWKALLKLLAESEHGRSAPVEKLGKDFGFYKKIESDLRTYRKEWTDPDLPESESVESLVRSMVKDAMGDLGRQLRKALGIRAEKGVVFEKIGDNYVASFLTRLLWDDRGLFRFGQPPPLDG